MAFAATNAMKVPDHFMDFYQSWAVFAMPIRWKRDDAGMTLLDFNYTTDRLAFILPGHNPRVVPTHYVVNRRDRLRTRGVSEGE